MITIETLFQHQQKALKLTWQVDSQQSWQPLRHLDGEPEEMVGYLNFLQPRQVVVIGTQELAYLDALDTRERKAAVEQLFLLPTQLVILADSLPVTDNLVETAAKAGIALLTSGLSAHLFIHQLQAYLKVHLASETTLHGVFMDVLGLGVLLTGVSGIGKSEIALGLINRGHRLVADDAPCFTRIAQDTLSGSCPELLMDFLEVRGLGILNIRAMFGDKAIQSRKRLQLIVRIVDSRDTQVEAIDRLHGMYQERKVLTVAIPEVMIPVAPGRHMAVLVEGAVRNQVLKNTGYNACDEFLQRQQDQIK